MKRKLNLLLIMVILAMAFQSCVKEAAPVTPIDMQSKSTDMVTVRTIKPSELPEGVIPKVINSEAELDAVISKLDKAEFKFAPQTHDGETSFDSVSGRYTTTATHLVYPDDSSKDQK